MHRHSAPGHTRVHPMLDDAERLVHPDVPATVTGTVPVVIHPHGCRRGQALRGLLGSAIRADVHAEAIGRRLIGERVRRVPRINARAVGGIGGHEGADGRVIPTRRGHEVVVAVGSVCEQRVQGDVPVRADRVGHEVEIATDVAIDVAVRQYGRGQARRNAEDPAAPSSERDDRVGESGRHVGVAVDVAPVDR